VTKHWRTPIIFYEALVEIFITAVIFLCLLEKIVIIYDLFVEDTTWWIQILEKFFDIVEKYFYSRSAWKLIVLIPHDSDL
jgi:hypothetical protein